MRVYGCYVLAVAAAMTASTASAAVLLSDDMSTGANWTVVGGADGNAVFGFDYSTVGIPTAPGAANTLALKLTANETVGAGDSIGAISNADFSAVYQVSFNFWANFIGDIEFGGAGSTEFIGGAIGHDGTTAAFDSGANLSFTGDAGSSTDLRAHEDGVLQGIADGGFNAALTGLNHPNINGELGLFPSVSAPGDQLTLYPSQTGSTTVGAAGFDWHEMVITVNEAAGTARFDVNGVHVVTLDAADGQGFNPAGGVGLIYADFFSSLAGDVDLNFGLFTNVEVTDVPEPASLALLGLGALAMFRRR